MDVGESVDVDAVVSDSDIDLFNNKPGDEDLNGEVHSYRYWKGPAKVKNPIQWWMDNKGVFPRLTRMPLRHCPQMAPQQLLKTGIVANHFGATVSETNFV